MAKSERRKLLEETMKKINKDNKSKSFIKFGDQKEDREVISFGVDSIDKFTGGGCTKGSFTVAYGGKSVGKTTLALHQIAKAQKEGKMCCLIDLEHGWDKERAIKLGVNVPELLILEETENAEQALDLVVTLAKEKVVDLIIIDSINAMSPKGEQETKKGKAKSIEDDEMALLARKLGKFFRIASPHIFRAKIAVTMIGQVRTKGIGSFYTYAGLSGGNALEHWTSTCLFLRQGQKSNAPIEKKKVEINTPDGVIKRTKDFPLGFECVIKMDKTKNSDSEQEGKEIHIPFYYKTGFNKESLEDVIENSEVSDLPVTVFDDEKKIDLKKEIARQNKELKKIKENNPHITKKNLKKAVKTSTDIEKEEKPKPKRGRPKKEK